MQIRRGSPRPPSRGNPNPKRPRPGSGAQALLPVATGVILAAPSAIIGTQMAKTYGRGVAEVMIRRGIPLVTGGYVSVQTALRALPFLQDQGFQMAAGGVTLGLTGFAAGAALGMAMISD